jgi:hypothetical protein
MCTMFIGVDQMIELIVERGDPERVTGELCQGW